jgi:uncharacterized protein YlzI (FlbEa/FlbD family)
MIDFTQFNARVLNLNGWFESKIVSVVDLNRTAESCNCIIDMLNGKKKKVQNMIENWNRETLHDRKSESCI